MIILIRKTDVDNTCGEHRQVIFHPKYGLHCAIFHKTHNFWVKICGNLQYQILSKSDEKCIKYWQHLIYALKETMVFTTLIFIKFTSSQWHYMQISHISQKIWKVWAEIKLYLHVKYDCHWAHFRETHACLTIL